MRKTYEPTCNQHYSAIPQTVTQYQLFCYVSALLSQFLQGGAKN